MRVRRSVCNYLYIQGDTAAFIPLDSVVDINTYVSVDSTFFSKDKNRVYYFYPDAGGGNIRLLRNRPIKGP
jgi:hypothetical protein